MAWTLEQSGRRCNSTPRERSKVIIANIARMGLNREGSGNQTKRTCTRSIRETRVNKGLAKVWGFTVNIIMRTIIPICIIIFIIMRI